MVVINDQGQDQASTIASEQVVGNEESGQASPSSTTAVAGDPHDNNDINDGDNELNGTSSCNLPLLDNNRRGSNNSLANDIANISPSTSSSDHDDDDDDTHDDSNDREVNNTANETTVRRRRRRRSARSSVEARGEVDDNADGDGGGGGGGGAGDWIINHLTWRNAGDPGGGFFADYFVPFCIAGAIGLTLVLLADIIEGIFNSPGGNLQRQKQGRTKQIIF